jgi:hypothetical protein
MIKKPNKQFLALFYLQEYILPRLEWKDQLIIAEILYKYRWAK